LTGADTLFRPGPRKTAVSIRRNSLYNLIGAVTPLVLALATIPLYLAVVGTERYGALAIAWLILGYFGLFDLGLGRAVAQRIAALHESTQEHRAQVFWTAAVVNIGIGLVGTVLLYFGARYFFLNLFEADEALIAEMLAAVPILAAAVPVATLTGVATGALQGREKFLDVNIATVIGTSLFQLFPLAVAYAVGPTLKWLILAAVIARVLGFLVMFSRVRLHLLKQHKAQFDSAEWLALLKFGGWVSVTTMVGPLIIIADRLMIGAILGAAAVAIYAVAFDIARRISLLPNALGQAIFPRIAKGDHEQRNALMRQSLGALDLFMTAPVIGALFIAGPFLELWVGPEVGGPAANVCRILLIAYWANAFAIIPFVRLQAQGRPDIVTKIILVQAPFHLTALYLALNGYGLLGAAVIVAARSIIEVFVMLYFANGGVLVPRSFLVNIGWLIAAYSVASNIEVVSVLGAGALGVAVLGSFATSWLLIPEESRATFRNIARQTLDRLPLSRSKG